MSDCSLFYLPTWYILCHYFFSSFLSSEFPESNATSADGRSSFKRGMEKRRLVWYYKTFSLLNRSYLDTAHILSIVDVFFWQEFLLLTDSDLAKDKTIFFKLLFFLFVERGLNSFSFRCRISKSILWKQICSGRWYFHEVVIWFWRKPRWNTRDGEIAIDASALCAHWTIGRSSSSA